MRIKVTVYPFGQAMTIQFDNLKDLNEYIVNWTNLSNGNTDIEISIRTGD